MSYRCEICGRVVPPSTPAARVVLAIRPRTYPYRHNAHRDPKTREPQRGKIERFTPQEVAAYIESRKGNSDPRDDSGGSGHEIAREVNACPECAVAHREAPPPVQPERREHAETKLIRCAQLRELGIIKDRQRCCPRCHTDAGVMGYGIREGYWAAYCCARTAPLAWSEIEAIVAKIPEWEARGALSAPKPNERLLAFGGIVRIAAGGEITSVIGSPSRSERGW